MFVLLDKNNFDRIRFKKILFHMIALSIQNPLYLCWQYESLSVAVLGGIKLEGLDRLRVTLKLPHVKRRGFRDSQTLFKDEPLLIHHRVSCRALRSARALLRMAWRVRADEGGGK